MEFLGTELNVKQGTLEEQDQRVIASLDVRDIVKLTQAAYDGLGTKDPNTLYVIVG